MDDEAATAARSRAGLHALAEQVLARARWEAVGRIGLEPTPGGFGTPPFPVGQVAVRTVRLDGLALVVTDDGVERRVPLTTLRAAADVAGTPLGPPPGLYPAATTSWPADAPLALDPASVAAVGAWLAAGAAALAAFAAARDAADAVTAATLWPEHFDLGLAAGAEPRRANYGVSPGDAGVPEPYAYVGPWNASTIVDDMPGAAYWNATSFPGAVLPATELPIDHDARVAALLAFFEAGRARLDAG